MKKANALAEIYTIQSFAQLANLDFLNKHLTLINNPKLNFAKIVNFSKPKTDLLLKKMRLFLYNAILVFSVLNFARIQLGRRG